MKTNPRLNVLLIIDQCNPESVSVPLIGYRFFQHISQLANVTLVTHGRNEKFLVKTSHDASIVYFGESEPERIFYRVAAAFSRFRNQTIWPLRLAFTYPIYNNFNQAVYRHFKPAIQRGDYDVVHAFSPVMPRYPVKVIEACQEPNQRTGAPTPFLLGPVNGGIPYPKGFEQTAKREFAALNVLRTIGRWILPGYRRTYEQADRVLAGSRYTAQLVKRLFPTASVDLLSENGLSEAYFSTLAEGTNSVKTESDSTIQLLFVGRLVPYKSADILIEAIKQMPKDVCDRVHLTIVGDGPERPRLEQITSDLNLQNKVTFAGWITQDEIVAYYQHSDLFCFPSVREFGGAVVLEAMACSLPCVVVDYGGIGEYVTAETGFKIEPLSRDFLVEKFSERIAQLVADPALRQRFADAARLRAASFRWPEKAKTILSLYQELIEENLESSPEPAPYLLQPAVSRSSTEQALS